MRAYPECIPCVLQQALGAARKATSDETVQFAALSAAMSALIGVDPTETPIRLGKRVQDAVQRVTGKGDPWRTVREQSDRRALLLYPRLKGLVADSPDRLLTASKIAVAGNIIDFGVPGEFDLEATLERVLREPFAVDDFAAFEQALRTAKRVLYLADNAGEIVFDRVLIEELPAPQFTVAVKSEAYVNDAMRQSATLTGLDHVAGILAVPPGASEPEQFDGAWEQADVIVAKGQANYETFSDTEGPLFFLLIAKCDCVARHLGVRRGDTVLWARTDRQEAPGSSPG